MSGPNGRGELVPPVAPTLAEFVAVEEAGADALVGGDGGALIPEAGDVMVYGDGGAGKTTLMIDAACHWSAGDDWLGMATARPLRVLLVENEGPRPLFRDKLRRKLAAWEGSPIGDRLRILEEPWARLSFADLLGREALADLIREYEIDVAIIGPVTRSGMNDAGTLQEVRDFMELARQARDLSGRPVVFVLIHHENKGGKVSGAWEGSGDTLLHVSGQGHGRTRLYVQKARWASAYHATTLTLTWTDGEGFELEQKPELSDDELAEQILAAVAQTPGVGWTAIEKTTPGVSKQTRRAVRDRLFSEGQIVNVGSRGGEWLAECPERRASRIYLVDDPTIQHLRPDPGADGAQSAPPTPDGPSETSAPCAPPIRGAGGAGADPPAADLLSSMPTLDPDEWTRAREGSGS